MSTRVILILIGSLIISSASAQRYADLGIRFNTADVNRIQIEFRKPFGENYFFRASATLGHEYQYPSRSILFANDSVVGIRQHEFSGNHYDLRFGVERKLTYDWLSLHGDIVVGYSSINNTNWSYFYNLDSTGTSWNFTHEDSVLNQFPNTARAITSFINVGLSLGLSFNFNLSPNLLLSFSANYLGMYRYALSQKESNDIFNEFDFSNFSIFDLNAYAGIGLRYAFIPIEKTEPLND